MIQRHHTAQRLLRPVKVVNPYAHLLTFADDRLRLRRDHKKYLNLIKAITFIHQYQREIKRITQQDKVIEYIEATLEDISFANKIACDIFGQSLDELAPASRKLLHLLRQMVKTQSEKQGIKPSGIKFSRRDIREYTKWSDHQVRDHLRQLLDLEYVVTASGSNGTRYFYELIYDGEGEGGEKFFMGLADMKTLHQKSADHTGTTVNLAPRKANLAPSLPQACANLAGGKK